MQFSPLLRVVLSRRAAILAAALVLCNAVAPSWGQVDTAVVSGSVVDSTNGYVAGASVVLENTLTGTEQTTSTNKDGVFTLVGILPGHYSLQVSARSFADMKLQNLVLNVGDQRTIEVKLHAGAAASISVDANGQTLNTTDASVSTVIDRKFVENIPLNGRSFQDLVSLTPGVLTQSPQSNASLGAAGDFSVNGQRTESNYYAVDGVSGNINAGNGGGIGGGNGTIPGATALGTTQSLVSVDALQEFRVESSTYSAQYGHGPGGQFSFVTRSGTNVPHGTVFDYLRNSYLDANDWFNDELRAPKPALRQNDFGGTLGAPLRVPWVYNGTNKTFLFVSYEGLRLTQPKAASILYVPDTALRATAAPILQPILNAFPVQNGKEELIPCTGGASSTYPCPVGSPTGTLVQSGLADFSESYSLPAVIDSTSVRIDHNFGPKLSVFFRLGSTPTSISARTLSEVTLTTVDTHTYTFGATSQFSSSAFNEFRLEYARTDAIVNSSLDSFGGAASINESSALGLSGYQKPGAYVSLIFSGVGSTAIGEEPSSSGARTWNVVDSITMSIGHHRIKAGFDFLGVKSLGIGPSPAVSAFYFSPEELQTNAALELAAIERTNAVPVFDNSAAFVQDEWQIHPRLSLSFGLRWEVDPPPHDAHGNDAYTLVGNPSDPSVLRLAPRGTPLWKTYWYNFAPRVGAAWSLHQTQGKETVLRTGAGVFFDTENEAGADGFSGLGFIADQIYFFAPLPASSAQLNLSPAAVPPYTQVYAFPSHLQVPYTLQWNVSLEQALGLHQSFTLSYVGANGRRLIVSQPLSLAGPNPMFGQVYTFPGDITSNYQALQAKFQRTVAHGVQALVSYTWSHSFDFGSTYNTFLVTRGNSDFDVRHNLSAGATWEIPAVAKSRISDAVVDHWGLDTRLTARTAFPIPLLGNEALDTSTGNYYYSGVNIVPGKPIYLYGHQYPGGRAINGGPQVLTGSAAFSLPTGSNQGNAPRNLVRGFGENQINLALRRSFPIRDSISLQFRAETFNILNHPNFGLVDSTLTDAQFGVATQTLNQSLATLASQYQQGGPRSVQFALKLIF